MVDNIPAHLWPVFLLGVLVGFLSYVPPARVGRFVVTGDGAYMEGWMI